MKTEFPSVAIGTSDAGLRIMADPPPPATERKGGEPNGILSVSFIPRRSLRDPT